jgi:hypothetical protein
MESRHFASYYLSYVTIIYSWTLSSNVFALSDSIYKYHSGCHKPVSLDALEYKYHVEPRLTAHKECAQSTREFKNRSPLRRTPVMDSIGYGWQTYILMHMYRYLIAYTIHTTALRGYLGLGPKNFGPRPRYPSRPSRAKIVAYLLLEVPLSDT